MKQLRAPAIFGLLLMCTVACKFGSSSSTISNNNTANSTSTDGKRSGTTTSQAEPTNIVGKYNITGTNPNGAVYKGTLEVLSRGDVYQFRWNAGAQYDGVGVQNSNVVAVAFANGSNGQGCGVVDYSIKSGGELDGKWGYWGTDESGTERATRKSGSGLEGDYDGAGKNPNGKEYKVSISVQPAGNLYHFAWSNNTEGLGIKQGDNVAVGIGGTRCGFVAYEIGSDGTLEGIWGGYGSDKTGTERATKQ